MSTIDLQDASHTKCTSVLAARISTAIDPPYHLKEEDPDETTNNRSRSSTKSSIGVSVRRLSASNIQEFTTNRESLPVSHAPRDGYAAEHSLTAGIAEAPYRHALTEQLREPSSGSAGHADVLQSDGYISRVFYTGRPNSSSRTLSNPPMSRRKSSSQLSAHGISTRRNSFHPLPRPTPLDLDSDTTFPPTIPKDANVPRKETTDAASPAPVHTSVPLPPMSIPTVLHLELAGRRPSPLYIHQSNASDFPYESSAVTFERLKNFLLLPFFFERTMHFGVFACMDAWMWTFTILPIRFCIALGVLICWWAHMIAKELHWLVGFVWFGLGRMWERGRCDHGFVRVDGFDAGRSVAEHSQSQDKAGALSKDWTMTCHSCENSVDQRPGLQSKWNAVDWNELAATPTRLHVKPNTGAQRHRRTKSMPSNLTSFHKADLLQGLVIICSSIALLSLDASRMYHFIRAQSQIKLYVIFNLLEMGDRLLAALGQDIFECLFSSETLSRNSSGRSKIMLPLGMFLLALIYNCLHSAVLFYQVITLNVAVNSYSNALLSLLMSNQFVEVKSAVFKRFEKENSFQLTCADIVERFQLWIMLLIIGMRNVVEVGGLWAPGAGGDLGGERPSTVPLHTSSNLPVSFTLLPSWIWSGEVLSPFLIVISSEILVDWIKHAYINKFNNIRPTFYGRILDILCKDYYTNAFVTPSLTRRLGLPLIPLSCLFIRASVQTYHMFLATHLPAPIPPSNQASLSVNSATPSPALAAGLDRLDNLIRNALGRAVYGYPYGENIPGNGTEAAAAVGAATKARVMTWFSWTSDDAIATLTMVIIFLLIFLMLLVVKLLLGMLLLRFARDRYARMKAKEHAIASGQPEPQRDAFDLKGSKRVGGYGQVEIDDERRRHIFADDLEGFRKLREKEKRAEMKGDKGKDLGGVMRYEMVAKRIW